jgi:peptidoglycan/LPS O-acetylase OafA/YrhL
LPEDSYNSTGSHPGGALREQVYETSDPRSHYVELDALRGIAIFGVVMTHLSQGWAWITRNPVEIPFLGANLLDLFVMGYLGVPLFFLLSGYLLTWTEGKRAQQGPYNVLSYAKRRALRLVPAYYVAVAVVIVLWPTNPSLVDIAAVLSFLHGFKLSFPVGLDPAFWSLTPEVVFYVLLPFLVLKFNKVRQLLAILGALLAVSLVTRMLIAEGVFGLLPGWVGEALGGNRMYFFPTTLLYIFIVGVLLRKMIEGGVGHRAAHFRLPVALLTVIPVAVLVALPYLIESQGKLLSSPAAMIAEGMVVLLFASVLLGSPVLKPVLGWRPLAFFGKISYSTFVLHNTVIYLSTRYVLFDFRPWFAEQGQPVQWVTFVVYTVCVLAVVTALAYLSYRYIESPFLQRKPK